MLQWFQQLDEILRGDATTPDALRSGRIEIPVGGLTIAIVILAIIYGACVGSYAPIRTGGGTWVQLVASAVKIPLLFLLTLVITMPSLYVFSALMGSRLTVTAVLRLLCAMLGVMMAVLASLGPILVFFAISTDHYAFMKVLNVIVGAIGGFLGLAFLLRTLKLLVGAVRYDWPGATPSTPPAPPPVQSESESSATEASASPKRVVSMPVDRGEPRVRAVFSIWVILFGMIGAQMSWLLRPLIGSPDLPFTWFRNREGNFFLAVLESLEHLLGR